ncbi:MAG: type II secretion system GspH family protein [Clostridium sp.]|nr:type II secretion system GspH family protein [Clostridium sp.]MCM1444315.1 type II secretion system GspH family protein [Candidatus Amulumruptor caecigallinarius]
MKGFTLIELMVVIILIGMIALIVYINFDDTTKTAEEQAYKIQVNNIISAAKQNWEVENIGVLPTNPDEVYELSLEDLKKSGSFEKGDIINPINGEVMNGCIRIKCSSETCKQYNYEYIENSCTGE